MQEPRALTVAPPDAADREFCRRMLPRVSRTFAICIRLLPKDLEHTVLVAYLLCRVADTLEDTTALKTGDKQRLLSHFSDCLDEAGPTASMLHDAFATAPTDEELLARNADAVLREFRRLPPQQRDAIRPWVKEMCAGMAEFTRGLVGEAESISTINTVQELDRYCYYVAGTVGHLLTELFHHHHASVTQRRYRKLKTLAVSFGLGLQLTNIIKDVADDRRRGRSFVPEQLPELVGIEQGEGDGEDQRSRQAMSWLIEKAKGHLCDALDYSTTLPRRQFRIRAFCLTSFYFAVRTLRLAERDPRLLDPDHKVKISRSEVYRTIITTKLVAPANSLVRRYFRSLAGETWWRRYREHQATQLQST